MRLIFCILLTFITLTANASRQMILKIVGSVENQILTNRDVEASFIVDHFLYNQSSDLAVNYGSEEFSAELNRLLIEKMVNEEAQVFGVAKVSESEIQDAYESVRQRITASATAKSHWQNLGFSDGQLKDMVGQKLRANRFIKYKSNSSFVQVSDEDARDYFNKNRLKFGTLEFDNFKNNIKKYLGQKNAEDRLRDWLEVLRKKHKVKNFLAANSSHPANGH